ncbi:hypothetical protein [Deinococcus pimensis]|uniref:hypothetical protein n=1 Tax=Deinococcus pimensis TaxID=309888 RepID=UPI000484E8C9|nr:hypothetical protein [Deinococcus pimensis]
MRNLRIWQWLTRPDPTPGFTVGKIGKLFLKSTLFALVAVTLQSLLALAEHALFGTRFFTSTWGTLLIVVLVYIPFARILSVDFMVPPRTPTKGAAKGGRPVKRAQRKKYAGVKKGGPRF